MRKPWLRIVLAVLFLLVWQPVVLTAHTPAVGVSAHRPETTAITQAAQQAIALAYPQGLEKAVAASSEAPGAMPPHPRLYDRIKSGQMRMPAFTDQIPPRSPGLNKTTSKASATGQLRVLVVLVDFSDSVKTVNASYFDTLVFAAPVTGRGSVRDYYNDVSYGAVDIVTANMPSSIGWKRVPNPIGYYVNNNYCTDGVYPNNCQKLAEDLVDAVSSVVDFSQYDNDGDGSTEPIMIVHSGPGAEFTGSASDIWSHSWSMMNPRTYNGKTISRYTIQPEYWQTVNTTTSDMTIGVFAHEMGHGFWNLPDLYDRDYTSQGIGRWSLMAGGSWNGQIVNGYRMGDSPAWPDAWSRIQMGFTTPTVVATNTASLSLPQAYNNGAVPTVYKLGSTILGTQEYFLLENREATFNTYDEYLPGQGLLIWHVDEAIITQNDRECTAQPHSTCPTGQHYLVALEQADGQRHMELYANSGDSADSFPGTGNHLSWTFLTNPESSSWYSTTDSYINVSSISSAGANMTATVNTGLVAPTTLNVNIPVAGTANLTWVDGSADESNFRIERSTDGGAYTQIGTSNKNVNSYSDTTINCGHSYTYQVRAYRNLYSGQYTAYSNTVTANPGTCPVPGAFGKISPVNNATGQPRSISLSWGTSSGATSYEYCYDTNSTGDCAGSWVSTGANTNVTVPMPAGTTFYWQVRARNATGTTYADSLSTAKWRFDILPNPGTFAKTTPTNAATGQPVNGVVLSWGSSTNAASYEYCYDTSNDSNCNSGNWITTGSALTATLPALTPGATYYWQVRAKNTNATVEASGGWWSFTVAPLPGSFGKSAPANGAVGQAANSLAISWGASSNVTNYEYCFDTSNDNACTSGIWVSTGTTASATLNSLTPGSTYYWQVRSNNATGITYADSGAWWSFTVLARPTAFSKTTPTNGATGQLINGLVMTWAASTNVTRYEYCYNTTGTACSTWTSVGTATTVTLNGLTANTTYYWQVRAYNINGTVEANTGTYWTFTTQPPPGALTKTSPANLATNQHTASLALTWGASTSATVYEYCLSTTAPSASGCSGTWTSTTTATTVTLTNLTAGTTYYWQARARNSSGAIYADGGTTATTDNPAWYWSFTTRATPDTFSKTAPLNGATGQPINGLSLSWAASVNATSYEYCVSTYPGCPGAWTTNGTARTATVNSLTPGTIYYWQVRALNAAGTTYANPTDPNNVTDPGVWWNFTTLPLPSGFAKSGPSNGSAGQPTSGLALTWAASTGATSYEYCLSTTGPTCPSNLWTTNGTTLTTTLNGLTGGMTYYWQVRAKNSSGTTEADAGLWWSFTTTSLPVTFTKSAPTNASTGQGINGLVLTWNPTTTPSVTYEYCVSSTGTSCSSGTWTSTGAATTATLNNLIAGVTYYWQVRATNTSGSTEADAGVWWSFTTTAYPGPFNKTAPTNNATGLAINNLALSWGASSNATTYEYCYSTSPSCPGGIWTSTGATRTATINGLTAGTIYYWQVRAVNSFGITYADSGWFSFTTQPLPGTFNKSAPTNGATGQLINGLAISWTSATNATSYEYCLSTTGTTCPGSWTTTGTTLNATLNSLMDGTTYYWQVRARNANGTTDASGGWWSFTTLSMPGAFAKTSPTNTATGQLTNGLALNWGISANATSYEYCYNSTATCPGDVWTSVNTAQTATLNNLNPGATYYWQVRAKNVNGVTYANNAWWSFTTLQLPGNFSKSSPSNGAIDQPVTGVALSWGVSSNASGYEYCVNTSQTCPNNIWTSTGTSRTATLTSLASGTTYYWQVRAWSVYGTTYADSGWFSFTTQTTASSFNKTAPTNGATLQPTNGLTLSWTSSSSATSYEYCTSTTGAACPGDIWTSTGAAVSTTLNGLSTNTTYYWQVRARNSIGTTDATGGWWTFTTTIGLPGGFNKSNPTNGATGQPNSGLVLNWGASSNVTSYEYCYDTTNDNACGSTWTSTNTALNATLGSLATNTTYYWQVRARNSNGTTDANSGAWWSFTTLSAGGAFGKSSPSHLATQQPTNGLVLNWGASSGATSYEYCFSKTTTCSPWYNTGTARTTTLNNLTTNTTYYWHVRSSNGTNFTYSDGSSSAMWQFTTTGTPPKVYLPLVIAPPPVYTITGRITFNGAGLGGITVNLTGTSSASVTTNSTGNYSFTVLAGSYTLTPSSSDYILAPVSRNVSVPPSSSGQDFTASTACTQLMYDRGFESRDNSWTIPATPFSAGFNDVTVHSGSWSLRAGIESPANNITAYSSAYQAVTVPSVLSSATLEFYLYPFSSEAVGLASYPDLTVGMRPEPAFASSLATAYSDIQRAMILDADGYILQSLVAKTSNSKAWEKYTFDLSGYRGSTIQIYFGTYNDGVGGVTGMYVDDTSLKICP